MNKRSRRAAGAHRRIEHVCCICRHRWHSDSAKEARDVVRATKANHDGPYCVLCLHLEMAARYSEARGYSGVREAMNAWKHHVSLQPVNP
jgi:hypothetical protein